MAVTDLTGTTWYFNNQINAYDPSGGSITLNFASNSGSYIRLRCVEEISVEMSYQTIDGGGTPVYGDGYWDNNAYRTIEITGGTDVTNANVIAWLEANATQVLPRSDAYITTDTDLTSVANAIRTKGGTSASLVYPAGYVNAINALPVGTLQSYKSAIYTSPGTATILPDSGYIGIAEISVEYSPSVYDGAYHTFVYPVKGDVITLNMDGTDRNYRVLKISGSVAEVLAQFSAGSSAFASSGQVYQAGTLDIFLNSTWYNACTATAKAAVVDKTFRQDKWYVTQNGTPQYVCAANGGTRYVGLSSATFGTTITRHIYALSVQDTVDYVEATPSMTAANTTFTVANTRTMFNTDISSASIWLRSASATNSSAALRFSPSIGTPLDRAPATADLVYPAFQIDLSKIGWSYAS